MGQIATVVNRREEGHLPNQPTINPKDAFEVGSSSQPHDTYHEQAKVVVTLRNGREVEIRPEEPKKDVRESFLNTKGSRVEKSYKKKEVNPSTSSSVPVVAPSYVPKAPFPTCLETPLPFGKKVATMDEMLKVCKQVKINLPLLEAIKQVPSYAKFPKDLCTQKQKS